MADEELAALADVVGILLDDLRRQRAAQQADETAGRDDEQPPVEPETKQAEA